MNNYDSPEYVRPLNDSERVLLEQQLKREGASEALSRANPDDLEVAYTQSNGLWTYAVIRHHIALYIGVMRYAMMVDENVWDVAWRVAFSRAIRTPPVFLSAPRVVKHEEFNKATGKGL